MCSSDLIEAGFAVSSPGEVEGIGLVAKHVRGCTIASLNRTQQADIDASWEALKDAESPRFHVFIATSDLHMEHKLRMTPEEVVEQTREAFVQIGEQVENVTERIGLIVTATAEVAAVAEQSSASTEQVSASTEETSASAQEIAASAQELAATAEELHGLVAAFKLAA